jgi:hypothetical protein
MIFTTQRKKGQRKNTRSKTSLHESSEKWEGAKLWKEVTMGF